MASSSLSVSLSFSRNKLFAVSRVLRSVCGAMIFWICFCLQNLQHTVVRYGMLSPSHWFEGKKIVKQIQRTCIVAAGPMPAMRKSSGSLSYGGSSYQFPWCGRPNAPLTTASSYMYESSKSTPMEKHKKEWKREKEIKENYFSYQTLRYCSKAIWYCLENVKLYFRFSNCKRAAQNRSLLFLKPFSHIPFRFGMPGVHSIVKVNIGWFAHCQFSPPFELCPV